VPLRDGPIQRRDGAVVVEGPLLIGATVAVVDPHSGAGRRRDAECGSDWDEPIGWEARNMDNKRKVEWRQSSRCESGNCIQVAHIDGNYVIRNSIDSDGPRLTFSVADWQSGQCIHVDRVYDDYVLRNSNVPDGSRLTVSEAEWQPFEAARRDGEFTF
jgi:Domain of unknown function (DUF397)